MLIQMKEKMQSKELLVFTHDATKMCLRTFERFRYVMKVQLIEFLCMFFSESRERDHFGFISLTYRICPLNQ